MREGNGVVVGWVQDALKGVGVWDVGGKGFWPALSAGREWDIVRVGGMLDVLHSMPEWDMGKALTTRVVILGNS